VSGFGTRPYLDPRDHAFAAGPTFTRPESLKAARALFDDPQDGDLLWSMFARWSVEGGQGLRLGLGARLSVGEGARVILGEHCVLRGVIEVQAGGVLELGARVYLGDGAIISVAKAVTIGDDVLISHDVNIFDNDTHPTDPSERRAHFAAIIGLAPPAPMTIASAPISIGSGAWIGFGAAVMKGATIGDDAIVAAKAVVVKSVPSGAIAAGNPARIVKGGKAASPRRLFRGRTV
jgi:acetyltransferase-like isoleucine patch superfamily enzyme